MEVIIVSKTHMSKASCVGALAKNGRFLRLLDERGNNQPVDTDYEVGQVWDLEFSEAGHRTPPHVEDVYVTSRRRIGVLDKGKKMLDVLRDYRVSFWEGAPDVLFDGLLQWTEGGSGYISEEGEIPCNSVGFWVPDRRLKKKIFYEKVRYDYPKINGWRSIPYVGYGDPVVIIPAGTLVRVSLARWWDRDGETEDRCSLQLSGWYDL